MGNRNNESNELLAVEDVFPSEKNLIMTQERWEGIVECKKRFIAEKNYDPSESQFMNPEVAASWIRSRKMGVDPHKALLGRSIKKEELVKISEHNRCLLDIIKPLVSSFKNLAISSSYGFYLADHQGVFLLHEGTVLDLPIKSEMNGLMWPEKVVGTTAHSLCLLHERPYILAGVENYSVALEHIVAAATPIHAENGKVIATLVLAQELIHPAWQTSYQTYCVNTLGLITAIAAAVDSQLRLLKSFSSLNIANKTLKETLTLINEGIITVNGNGTIIYSNEDGRKIFRIPANDVEKKNINDYLGENSPAMAMARRGESGTVEETIRIENNEDSYIIDVHPFEGETNTPNGALLKINNSSKINAITTNRTGAVASFTFDDIIGESDMLRRAITRAQYFAKTGENVLLIGESGTGKELFAQSIHNRYNARGPFIAVNCAALPRELIESELFGYEAGAFTGADRSGRPGKIELAEGGTLFLDEIGDMPIELQAVLLRVLEDKQVMRIGGTRYKKVDFRVVAATNQDLSSLVKERLFREDLYYRLSVLTINVPALRERNGDFALLTHYFINKYCAKLGRSIPKIDSEVMDLISGYNWPGNVRELENAIVYAVINADSVIKIQDLSDEIVSKGATKPTVDSILNYSLGDTNEFPSLNDIERSAIQRAMSKTDGNVILAACLLGISKSTIYRKLKEYEIPF